MSGWEWQWALTKSIQRIFWDDENILKMDCGDRCTTLYKFTKTHELYT